MNETHLDARWSGRENKVQGPRNDHAARLPFVTSDARGCVDVITPASSVIVRDFKTETFIISARRIRVCRANSARDGTGTFQGVGGKGGS